MELNDQKKVGEVVAEDFRTARVFEKYGIDFCCKGHTTIDEACERKNIMTEDVMRELKLLLAGNQEQETDFQSWNAAHLVDYIEEKHHRYVEETSPVILRNLDKLCHKHGPGHPELFEIRELFMASAADLAEHMQKEEKILFPLIRKMTSSAFAPSGHQMITPGLVRHPIEVMMQEHEHEGDRFFRIDLLSNHYQPPADACNTYKVTFGLLKAFEQDLHLHIHLENNILFPKALEPARMEHRES
jgi:regulator of cell morphogenesis and NO signaling